MRVTSDGLVLIGSTSGSNTLDVTGTLGVVGATSINTSGSAATNIASGTSTGAVNIGTGANAATVTIGRTGGTLTTIGSLGHTGTATFTGATDVNVTGSAATNINSGASTGNVTIGGSGTMSILIGNGTGVQTIALGDGGTGAKTVTLGSTASTGTTTIQSGSGGVLINQNNNQTTSINSGTSTGAVNIGAGASSGTVTIGGAGTQTIAIGNGAAAKTVSLGSNSSTSTTTLLSGSGGLNLNASNNQPTNINTGTSTGAVNIGTSLTTVTVLGTTNINTTGSSAGTTIGNTAVGTAVTINTGTTGRLTLGGLPVQTVTSDDVVLINGSNQVSRVTQANFFAGQGWSLTGNSLSTPTTQYLGSNNATPLAIRTNNLERLRVASDGMVLIGTTSGTNALDPGNGRLEVASTTASRYGHLVVRRDNAGATGGQLSILNLATAAVGANAVLAFGIENSTVATSAGADESNAEIRAVLTNVNGAADLRFSTWSGSANGVRMNIAADGRVGIGTGTTAPGAQLQVTSTAAGNVGAIIRGASGQTNDLLEIQDNAGTQVFAIASSGITGTAKTSIGTNDRVLVAGTTGMVDNATPATIISAGTIGGLVATAGAVNSQLVTDANVTANDIIMVTLETSSSTAVIPAFTVVRAAGSFTVHFSAPFNGSINYTITNRP